MKELFKDYITFLNQKQNFYNKLETIINKPFLFVKKNKIMIVKGFRNYYGFKVISFIQHNPKGIRKLFRNAICIELSDLDFFQMYENKEIIELKENN